MTKDTKTPSPSTPSKSTTSSTAAPRKKLTLNTTAFQKKLSTISVNNIFRRRTRLTKKCLVWLETKRAREKQKTKYQPKLTSSQKIVREVDIPVKISIQELASRMSEKTGDVVKALMKMVLWQQLINTLTVILQS